MTSNTFLDFRFKNGDWINGTATATITTNLYSINLDNLRFEEFPFCVDACNSGTDWSGETISVKNGIVTIVIISRLNDLDKIVGYLNLSANLCSVLYKAWDNLVDKLINEIQMRN